MHGIHSRQTGPKRQPWCHQKDTAVLTLPGCHTLCFSSSRTPGSAKFLFLSIFHALSHFLLIKKLFHFLCHCLNFLSPISLSLPLFQASSFSCTNHLFSLCLQTFHPRLPPGGIRVRTVVSRRDANQQVVQRDAWAHKHRTPRPHGPQCCFQQSPVGLINV